MSEKRTKKGRKVLHTRITLVLYLMAIYITHPSNYLALN